MPTASWQILALVPPGSAGSLPCCKSPLPHALSLSESHPARGPTTGVAPFGIMAGAVIKFGLETYVPGASTAWHIVVVLPGDR